jgi:GT2 family glycosyltransferase
LNAVSKFAAAATAHGVDADFTVFDDGSTDGTAEALAALDLPVTVIAGDGTAFWSRGMAEAEDCLFRVQHDDGYIVWLNDDVELYEDALEVALAATKSNPEAVLVGAMQDPATAQVTYSGNRNSRLHPLRSKPLEPNGTLQSIDTFCGNFVLVPMKVARAMGGIDHSLSHFGADTDYGLRLRERGIAVLLLPRAVGACAPNPVQQAASAAVEWRSFRSAKGGGNFNTLRRILKKQRPHSWPLHVAITYMLWWFKRAAPIARTREIAVPLREGHGDSDG